MYRISDLTRKRARQIGVEVLPSTNPEKKIDVFFEGEKVASVGATGYKDYHVYLATEGKKVADERRRLYYIRHTQESLGEYLAKWLLWT